LIRNVLRLELCLKKHPDWPTNTFHQVAILSEEAGEIAKAANDRDTQGIKTELYQTAAMCLRMLKNMKDET
jgi:NTP pyrophosphatase (non-canonical NTP hydrolase)